MSEKRQRQKRVTIRFADDEYDKAQTYADMTGLSLSGFGRSKILDKPPLPQSRRPSVNTVILAKLMGHVGKIGSNVNQLTRTANMGGWPGHEALQEAQSDIRWMRDMLFKALEIDPYTPKEER